jgi:hypothetical protein
MYFCESSLWQVLLFLSLSDDQSTRFPLSADLCEAEHQEVQQRAWERFALCFPFMRANLNVAMLSL